MTAAKFKPYVFPVSGFALSSIANHDLEVEVEVTLRLRASQSLCLGIEHPCGTCEQILLPVGMLLPDICGLIFSDERTGLQFAV
jgi:hypothetical protein